jgi:hypothetical protein
VREKGNRHHTTLILLNSDAKALCLRPDPELVKVSGVPPRRRSEEPCPSAGPKDAPVASDSGGGRRARAVRRSFTTLLA